MQFNPLQNEETNTGRGESKSKSISSIVTPMCLKQLQHFLSDRQAAQAVSKIQVVGRVLRLKQMVGRTIVTICDETGVGNIIQVQNADQLQEDQYYQFIVFVKMDKEEAVLMSYQSEKITDYNRIQFHFANIMMAQASNPTH